MTSAPVRDPIADHLLTPQNAALLLIDYQPAQLGQLPPMDLCAATAHFRLAGHPVVRWYEPGEDWYWCYLDGLVFELEGAPAAPSHL